MEITVEVENSVEVRISARISRTAHNINDKIKVGEVVVNNNLEPMTRCGTVFFGGLLYLNCVLVVRSGIVLGHN